MANQRLAILALDGSIALDLAIPCQVFGSALLLDGRPAYDVRVCGSRGASVGINGLPMFTASAQHPLTDALKAGTIIVPGLLDVDASPPKRVVELLRTASQSGIRIASVCTGAFVLAAAGLLDGYRATTHWQDAPALARRYPDVEVHPDVLFVDNEGVLLTSAGLSAGLDLCLYMIGHDHGAAVAAATARRLVVPLTREGGQSQFIVYDRPTDTGGLRATLDWLEANLSSPLTLEDIAAHAGSSVRSLTRHFQNQVGMTPMQQVLRMRVQRAQELLETTDIPIERISDQVGFGSSVAFRQQFIRRVGISPQRYRTSFRASQP